MKMTIHHIYIILGYALWAYILIYICVKVLSKLYNDRCYDKYVEYVENFFKPDDKRRTSWQMFCISKITDDDRFFYLCCKCYLQNTKSCTAEQKEKLKKCLTGIADYKIYMTSKHNRLTRCLIIGCVLKCSLKSKKINNFIHNCQKGGEAQRQWLLYWDEFTKSMFEEESKWR